MKLIDRMRWWHAAVLIMFASIAGNIVREIRHELAIADTHPKGGDAQQAPSLMSGGGAEGNRTNSIGTS